MGDRCVRGAVSVPHFTNALESCLKRVRLRTHRYFLELIKMKETFIDPLLHPYATNALSYSSPIPDEDYFRSDSPVESVDHLPIASRFLGSSIRSETPATIASRAPTLPAINQRALTPVIPTPDGDSAGTDDEDERPYSRTGNGKASVASKSAHPRSPYGTAARGQGFNLRTGKPILPFPSRSHASLPPPPRNGTTTNPMHMLGAASTSSLRHDRPRTAEGERDRKDTGTTRVLKKLKRNTLQAEPTFKGGLPPHLLPEDLRQCLEVIENGILPGHAKLSEALRKRYEEQYPLVRSLADVFVTHVRSPFHDRERC